ncbi:MAG: hypothetical protein ABTQ26_04225 [Azonexus sp.]
MNGLPYYLPRQEVIFVPFLDCVSLLHQRRVVYALWKKAPDSSVKCCKVFLRDPSFLARFTSSGEDRNIYSEQKRLISYLETRAAGCAWISVASDCPSDEIIEIPTLKEESERFGISIHTLGTIEEFLDPRKMVLDIDNEATKQVRRLLHQESTISLSSSFREALHLAASEQCNSQSLRLQPGKRATCRRAQLSSDELDYFLTPMTEAMNEIAIGIGSFPSGLRIKKSGLPNLFAVVKIFTFSDEQLRYKDQFNYTCRFMLLEEARRWIQNKFPDPDKCIRDIQAPLPLYMRSLADHVFSNETVTFKLDPDGGGLSDIDKFDAAASSKEANAWLDSNPSVEQEMYPNEPDIFYIPIHVNLVPWITIYTLSEKRDSASDEEEMWYHNYLFYRHVVQRVAPQIRSKAASVYFDLFAQSILHGLSDVHSSLPEVSDTINARLLNLAQIYPFPLGTFEAKEPQHPRCLSMGTHGQLYLELKSNPFFGVEPIDSDVKLEDLLSYCQERVDAFLKREMLLVARNVADAGHLIKKPLAKIEALARKAGNTEISAFAKKLLLRSMIAEARLSDIKRSQHLNKRDRCSCGEFRDLVHKEYFNVVDLLSHPIYSSNIHIRLQKLNEFFRAVPVELDIGPDQYVIYYDLLLPTVVEGMVSNAVANLCVDNPYLAIILENADGRLMLSITNSVDSGLDIEKTLSKLNNPGVDFIGVSQLHWITDVFWAVPPVWVKKELGATSCICATIQVGVLK